MKKSRASASFLPLSLAISIVGFALVIFMILELNLPHFQTLIQRISVGFLYCTLCMLGIAAVFFPVKCRVVFDPVKERNAEAKTRDPVQIIGHHPNCQNFSANRLRVGRRTLCAACTGLLFGAIIALAGTIFYFFGNLELVWKSIWLVASGEVLMLAGLTQIWFAGTAKAALNAVFVTGSFVMLVEVDALLKSLFVDLYVFGLILFLLWIRISLSEWYNRRTCLKCQSCFG